MRNQTIIIIILLFIGLKVDAQIEAPTELVKFYTQEWAGERFPDGRPKVEEAYLQRVLNLSIEEVWTYLHNKGYNCQFDAGWETVNDQPFVGRAVTVQYLPSRPDVHKAIMERGHKQGHVGHPNSWPIELLKNGDVYVADARGKVVDGTLIGDNLGNSIYAKSKNGVVFDGSARDLEGLSKIEGFNAYVRGFDPSYIFDLTMMGINVPVQVGRAVVMPGDVVLAKKEGVIFIPPQFLKEVVLTGEFVKLRDTFGHKALIEGWFTTGEIDTEWTDEIKTAFFKWVDETPGVTALSKQEMETMFRERNW